MLHDFLSPEARQDRVRGCLIGGAAGDALGYPVEFMSEDGIAAKYGPSGICSYTLDGSSGKALISDDTQMTLFTANAMLCAFTRNQRSGASNPPSAYAASAYCEWYATQTMLFDDYQQKKHSQSFFPKCWLTDVPELFHPRAPGTTCMTALYNILHHLPVRNDSKGCGGVMRVAPLGTVDRFFSTEEYIRDGAAFAKVTHQHPLGYLPAALLVAIVHRCIYEPDDRPLYDLVDESIRQITVMDPDAPHIGDLEAIMRSALRLSQNDRPDLENIHQLGEGWVGEEALAVSVYCALRHEHDFSAGIIASVNHCGDSDSTGAITGQILGTRLGYAAIEDKWKTDLELTDVMTELADDLAAAVPDAATPDDPWVQKYVYAKRVSGR